MNIYNHQHPPVSETTTTNEIEPLFPSHGTKHGPLSFIQRAGIVVLYKDGQMRKDIATKIGTSIPTVRHWINHFEQLVKL